MRVIYQLSMREVQGSIGDWRGQTPLLGEGNTNGRCHSIGLYVKTDSGDNLMNFLIIAEFNIWHRNGSSRYEEHVADYTLDAKLISVKFSEKW